MYFHKMGMVLGMALELRGTMWDHAKTKARVNTVWGQLIWNLSSR